jgi:hypothetical protein
MLMNKGEALYTGSVDEAISRYHDIIGQEALVERYEGAATVQINGFALLDDSGEQTANINTDQDVVFRIEARFSQAVQQPMFGIRIHSDAGQLVYQDGNPPEHARAVAAGETIRCDIRMRPPLSTGTYTARAMVVTAPNSEAGVAFSRNISFYVGGRRSVKGVADLRGTFEFGEPDPHPSGDAQSPSSPLVADH